MRAVSTKLYSTSTSPRQCRPLRPLPPLFMPRGAGPAGMGDSCVLLGTLNPPPHLMGNGNIRKQKPAAY